MATACIPHGVFRVHGISQTIVAKFDQPHASSDGGALLLKAIDDRLGLTWRLASVIRDGRQPGKVEHSLRDLVRQRVFGLACGYADCNDAARLVDDPIHKLLLDRDPLDGPGLGSQPTLSRFENAVDRADLYRLGTALADTVLTHHRGRLGASVRLITIDLDATDDPTHGQQEFALFNGYYDTWCYLPLIATVTFNTEPIQHVVAALLRPGTGAATRGVRGLLRRLFDKLRTLFPRARLRVRADAGFADAKLLAFLDAAEVEYVLGLASNRRLDKRVRRLLGRARMQARSTGDTATLYGETRYAARRWDRKRRIIMKAEVLCYPGGRARTIRGFSSRTCRIDRLRCTRASTAGAATWRTGSKNCSTGWPWIARVARASPPTSCGCCSPSRPTPCSRRCRLSRASPDSARRRSGRCASDS
jgi:Transposase DDE domain group 1